MKKAYGDRYKGIITALMELDAALSLSDIDIKAVHPLEPPWEGHYAMNISANYRLIFQPCDDPPSLTSEGHPDPNNIKSIQIMAIEDYH